jgi:hypothetical protein
MAPINLTYASDRLKLAYLGCVWWGARDCQPSVPLEMLVCWVAAVFGPCAPMDAEGVPVMEGAQLHAMVAQAMESGAVLG